MLRARWPSIAFSSVYYTAAREFERQDHFLNAAARIEIKRETPEELAIILKALETRLGKAPPFRFGPRTIDIDILLWGDDIIPNKEEWRRTKLQSAEKLLIPHPRMHERRFVLEPLCDLIDPTKRHPVLGKTWAELLEACTDQDSERTDVAL